MREFFLLVLLSGAGPNSTAILANGGSTLAECEALGRERIAHMSPVKSWTFPIGGGPLIERVTPASEHWTVKCIR